MKNIAKQIAKTTISVPAFFFSFIFRRFFLFSTFPIRFVGRWLFPVQNIKKEPIQSPIIHPQSTVVDSKTASPLTTSKPVDKIAENPVQQQVIPSNNNNNNVVNHAPPRPPRKIQDYPKSDVPKMEELIESGKWKVVRIQTVVGECTWLEPVVKENVTNNNQSEQKTMKRVGSLHIDSFKESYISVVTKDFNLTAEEAEQMWNNYTTPLLKRQQSSSSLSSMDINNNDIVTTSSTSTMTTTTTNNNNIATITSSTSTTSTTATSTVKSPVIAIPAIVTTPATETVLLLRYNQKNPPLAAAAIATLINNTQQGDSFIRFQPSVLNELSTVEGVKLTQSTSIGRYLVRSSQMPQITDLYSSRDLNEISLIDHYLELIYTSKESKLNDQVINRVEANDYLVGNRISLADFFLWEHLKHNQQLITDSSVLQKWSDNFGKQQKIIEETLLLL